MVQWAAALSAACTVKTGSADGGCGIERAPGLLLLFHVVAAAAFEPHLFEASWPRWPEQHAHGRGTLRRERRCRGSHLPSRRGIPRSCASSFVGPEGDEVEAQHVC